MNVLSDYLSKPVEQQSMGSFNHIFERDPLVEKIINARDAFKKVSEDMLNVRPESDDRRSTIPDYALEKMPTLGVALEIAKFFIDPEGSFYLSSSAGSKDPTQVNIDLPYESVLLTFAEFTAMQGGKFLDPRLGSLDHNLAAKLISVRDPNAVEGPVRSEESVCNQVRLSTYRSFKSDPYNMHDCEQLLTGVIEALRENPEHVSRYSNMARECGQEEIQDFRIKKEVYIEKTNSGQIIYMGSDRSRFAQRDMRKLYEGLKEYFVDVKFDHSASKFPDGSTSVTPRKMVINDNDPFLNPSVHFRELGYTVKLYTENAKTTLPPKK